MAGFRKQPALGMLVTSRVAATKRLKGVVLRPAPTRKGEAGSPRLLHPNSKPCTSQGGDSASQGAIQMHGFNDPSAGLTSGHSPLVRSEERREGKEGVSTC